MKIFSQKRQLKVVFMQSDFSLFVVSQCPHPLTGYDRYPIQQFPGGSADADGQNIGRRFFSGKEQPLFVSARVLKKPKKMPPDRFHTLTKSWI